MKNMELGESGDFLQNSLVAQNRQKKKLIVNTLEDQDEDNAWIINCYLEEIKQSVFLLLCFSLFFNCLFFCLFCLFCLEFSNRCCFS